MRLTIFKQFFHDTSLTFSPSSKFQRQIESKKEEKRWWLFYATDFQSLMYPCFIFCRILGIFPYKINASSFETSKSYNIPSTIIMCFFCFNSLIIICMGNIYGWFHGNVHRSIAINSFYIFNSFIMIITFVLSSPRIRLVQIILQISSRLPSESYQQSSMLIHAKDIFGFSFLLIQSALCYDPHFSIMAYLSTIYMILLVFVMDMLYINCVCVLKACFKKINDDLTNLLITNNKSHSVMWIYHEQRNHLLLMELNNLKKRHLMVSDIVQRLNIIFSPQLLATIALSFFEVTFELYFNMVEWKNGLYINLTKQIHHTYVLTYITYYFVKIALIAWACETGKSQAIKISTTVHDVLNNINDEQIKHELQLFSLQIMHCDNTFSTKCLSLDATLLTMIMGTITTYVLILIQFLIASHSCDGKIVNNVTQTI
ncbi:Putative gustatory receptor 28b [Trachymyrmex cornetzi]|uniref:Gustatory receptor n=1 Tax=Trachymyrmex cornetzi TaxID=471704 RepID=A0A195DPS4_9HYME|nr:Putative gustatory receptor 28b [Trachymyrmex cornetzi]